MIMTDFMTHHADPRLDLEFERIVDVPAELIWAAWTTPALIKQWFTPAPWKTVDSEIDLRPGGIFRTTMRSPEGQDFPNAGCYLEVVENRKLVWTNVLGPGYRPSTLPDDDSCDSFAFTAVVTLQPQGAGTRYRALVIHGNEASRKKHEEMGFHEGWGKALDQLVALMKHT
jgi:uncharacterized protein YndB with AHSA1/START domain